MSSNLLHTPEGVRDIYGSEYQQKKHIEALIGEQMHRYGYEGIDTPTFEFFDVFSKEVGTTSSKDLYKFFDKEGNTLVLRPDFTPSMARCGVKYFGDNEQIRFSYCGSTFANTSNLQGKLKEATQMGAELMGDDSVHADAEMIALLIDSLKACGLKDFIVSVGNVDYLGGLCEEAGLSRETELELREFLCVKNLIGAQQLLCEANVDDRFKEALLNTGEIFGQKEALDKAEEFALNGRSKQAIERLRELYENLKLYGVEQYVSFDLSMISKYYYYTGIIFRAYTYGVGDAICKGGRYDNLLSHFGKDLPAVGFMVLVDDLLNALKSKKLTESFVDDTEILYYNADNYEEVLKQAIDKRKNGSFVRLCKMK